MTASPVWDNLGEFKTDLFYVLWTFYCYSLLSTRIGSFAHASPKYQHVCSVFFLHINVMVLLNAFILQRGCL